jgi:molybdopterin-guanine dinucleotide biosynthesis protein
MTFQRPVLGVVGTSGSGKTTLIEQLVALPTDAGTRVAVGTYARAGFDPAIGRFVFRQAGLYQSTGLPPFHLLSESDSPCP